MYKFSNLGSVVVWAVVLSIGFLGFVANAGHSWGNYHWARSGDVLALQVGDNVSPTWDAYLDEAIADWNVSPLLNLTKVLGGTNASKGKFTPKNCVPTYGRIEVCSAKYGSNGWLGLAQIWTSGGHIVQSTTKVNDTYFNTATYNTPAWRRLVMCQEIAHDFGLDHQDEVFNNANLGTCMDYTNDPDGGLGGAVSGDPSNEHPNVHDFEQIETIYNHLEGSFSGQTSFGSGNSFFSNGVNGLEVAEWGKSIRSSSDGKSSLFERDLGKGVKVFTFVIWAN